MMKKYITWKLDNNEPIDPADPLGEITINGDKGIIKEKDTFLDSYLEALVEGLNSIETQNTVKINLVDEPHNLVFLRNEKEIKIQYGNQNVTIIDLALLRNQLCYVIADFLQLLDEASGSMGKKKYDFFKLRQFANKSSDELL